MRGTRAALAWNTCVPRERVRTTLASDGARAATLCSIHNQGESVYSNGAMFVTRRLLHLAPLLAAIDAGCSGFLTKDRVAAEVATAVPGIETRAGSSEAPGS